MQVIKVAGNNHSNAFKILHFNQYKAKNDMVNIYDIHPEISKLLKKQQLYQCTLYNYKFEVITFLTYQNNAMKIKISQVINRLTVFTT